MTTARDKVAELITLPNQKDYFVFNEDKQVALQLALSALFLDEPGIPEPILALSAPSRVNLDKQSKVPVLVASVKSGLRSWQVNYTTNLHLFVRELSSGKLWVAEPLANMRRGGAPLLSGKGTPPNKLNATSWSTGVNWFNLPKKLPHQFDKGVVAVTAVAHDIRSNSVSIHLESAKPPPEAQTPSTQPYVRHTLDKSSSLPTKVEFDGALIKVATQITDTNVANPPSGQPLWSFNVILVQLDEETIIIPVTMPVQSVTSAEGKQAYNAVFEVDLKEAAGTLLTGEYQVYVDIGSEWLGPYLLTHFQRDKAQ